MAAPGGVDQGGNGDIINGPMGMIMVISRVDIYIYIYTWLDLLAKYIQFGCGTWK